MKQKLQHLAEEYERRYERAGFVPASEFKARFLQQARQLPVNEGIKWRKLTPFFAVAAGLLLCVGLFWRFMPEAKPDLMRTSLLTEARRLFEPDGLGVALVNGEIATFERTETRRSDSIFELNFNFGGRGKPLRLQFAAASGEVVRIDTPQLQGEFWVYKIDRNLYAINSDCRVKTPDGFYADFADFAPVRVDAPEMERLTKFTVNRRAELL